MKKVFKIFIWLLVVAYICFIFSNSLMDGLQSSEYSTWFGNLVLRVFNHFNIYIDSYTLLRYIRKIAHFIEFFGLGFLVTLAVLTCPIFKSKILNLLLFIVPIPFLDEQIQKFIPDRVSSLKDVMIDGAGVISGILLCIIIYVICKGIYHLIEKYKKQKAFNKLQNAQI